MPEPTSPPAPSTPENNGGNPANSTPTPTPTPRKRADQDQQLAERANETRQIVGVITSDSAVRAKLAPKGFDTQRLTDAIALCDVFDTKWNERQNAMGAQAQKAKVFGDLFSAAKTRLSDLRELVRAETSDAATLKALGISEEVPDDLETFLGHAKSAYTTAKKPESSALATKLGYTAAALDVELAALETLRKSNEDHSTAAGDAQKATSDRDKAFVPVNGFRNSVMKIARRVFRTEPEQLVKLDF